MYFGSVRFFRHLILIVTALLIVIPIIISIVLFSDNLSKQAEIERLQASLSEYTQSSENKEDPASQPDETSESTASQPNTESGTEVFQSGGDTTAEPQSSSAPESSEPQTQSEESAVSLPVLEDESSALPDEPEESSDTSVEEPDTGSPYSSLYTDMYVDKYTGEYINDDNTVYLTFDDGPSSLTEEILYYLDKKDVKATFFVVPNESEECTRLLKKISDAGHTIGIHSYTHDYETIYASADAFLEDFNKAYEIVCAATGEKPKLFRFAGGSINDYNGEVRDEIIAEMERRGFTYFDWNVDSNDWQGYGWQELYDNVTADASELSTPVILFHDTGARMNTVLVIEDIISSLRNKGYSFAALSEKTEPVQF